MPNYDAKPKHELKDQIFGKWIVVSYAGNGHWNCLCECLDMYRIHQSNLRRGKTTSCGKCKDEMTNIEMIDAWIKNPERKKYMEESIRLVELTKKHLAEATRINHCDMNKPITI